MGVGGRALARLQRAQNPPFLRAPKIFRARVHRQHSVHRPHSVHIGEYKTITNVELLKKKILWVLEVPQEIFFSNHIFVLL